MELLKIHRSDEAELMWQALLTIVLKPKAPRLTASTPAACVELMRLWGEYTQHGTAEDGGITI